MITDDLFIGAWVSCYGEIGTVAMLNEETCAIWKNGDMSKEENYIATAAMAPLFPGDLNPIPLTLDILEKNGFKYKESIDRWCFKSTQFGLYKIEDCFIGVVCGMYRYVKYVHELQQLLKLATIDYKIIL